jgi:hypothetical protein
MRTTAGRAAQIKGMKTTAGHAAPSKGGARGVRPPGRQEEWEATARLALELGARPRIEEELGDVDLAFSTLTKQHDLLLASVLRRRMAYDREYGYVPIHV